LENIVSNNVIATDGRPLVNPGNLGHLSAWTNGPAWDVTFTTENGGLLIAPGTPNPDYEASCSENPFTGVTECTASRYLSGDTLKYTNVVTPGTPPNLNEVDHSRKAGSATYDYVLLDMAVGLARAFASGNNAGSVYAIGEELGTPVHVPASRVGYDNMIGSQTTPVSFASVIGVGNTVLDGLTGAVPGYEGVFSSYKSTLASKGFKAVPETNPSFFYINVGIHPDNTPNIQGVANKTFSETITFQLMAGY